MHPLHGIYMRLRTLYDPSALALAHVLALACVTVCLCRVRQYLLLLTCICFSGSRCNNHQIYNILSISIMRNLIIAFSGWVFHEVVEHTAAVPASSFASGHSCLCLLWLQIQQHPVCVRCWMPRGTPLRLLVNKPFAMYYLVLFLLKHL